MRSPSQLPLFDCKFIMASVTFNSFSLAIFSYRVGNSKRCFFKTMTTPTIKRRVFAPKIQASSTVTFIETKPDCVLVEKDIGTGKNILACPICYDPLTWNGDPVLSLESMPGASLQCCTCKKTYIGKETHLELTVASEAKVYGESMPLITELFRTPLVSFLYERGWRQGFSTGSGFPGPEKEFEMAKDYFKPVLGGNVIDASCGSGLFSRLFAKSGLFSQVVALDFSENMLRECYGFIKQEENFPKENLILVRADIARLPFVSSSVDALHAGAALHCWPSPSAAVAEISRVLRPGGVFVATTYIVDGLFGLLFPLLRPLRQTVTQISGSQIFMSNNELEDLCKACGLVDFTCVRDRRFVMISATKPS